jgi:hypothetical protein
MAFIVQNLVGDQRLELAAEDFVRPVAIGSGWTWLRIGVRLFMATRASFTGGDFNLGVSEGPYSKSRDDGVDTLGITWGTANPHAMTWITVPSGPDRYQSCNSAGFTAWRKVGPAYSQTTTTSLALRVASQPHGPNVSGFYLDLIKTATGATLTTYSPHVDLAVMTNLTSYQHMINMETTTPPYNAGGVNTVNFAFSGNQAWDHFFIGWSRSLPVLHVKEITLSRFQ